MSVESGSNDAEAAATGAAASPFAYNARLAGEIEARWQQRWAELGTFASPNPVGPLSAGFDEVKGRRKFFILDMFPYPSGSGLHVGHPLGYIGTDVLARYLRMTGNHVLHTFGYDAFGLPAEQYAIETGQHPAITTQNNIDNMRVQLRRLGLGHDTRREVATADPSFYRWTQWIFLQIFNSWYDEAAGRARHISELVAELAAGQRPVPGGESWDELSAVQRRQVVDGFRLAYISSEMVNWCPGLGTVLANEEVTADGRSDVGNHLVYRRPLRQWMLRITAYADRLLADLDELDWPESIKQLQRNWIGQGDGARIDLAKAGDPGTVLTVFTTRPDTLAGATYVVLAPEHPLVDRLTAASSKEAVDAYRDQAAQVSDRQRTAAAGAKTGVFTGAHVINPANGEAIPVYVADYILMGYGTGAIMAVPAHDQRDFEFARKFGLEIRAVLEPVSEWLVSRGLAEGTPADAWPESYADEGEYLPSAGGAFVDFAGMTKQAAVTATIEWLAERGLGGSARFYRLRDWLFSRQRYWGEPFPIVYDQHDLPVAVPDDQLPVLLPEMTEFRPAEGSDAAEAAEPVPPLSRVPGWSEVELDLGEGPQRYRRELNTMPQWAGSCWYYLRYLDPSNDQRFADPVVERYWMAPPDRGDGGGVDLYVGGVEHAVLHLLYARFWHKVLFDLGQVSTKEPFHRLYNQGYILADAFTDSRGLYVPAVDVAADGDALSYHGEPVTRRSGKMGKSLKNGVSPDDIYAQYGADTLRIYEMFMGPLNVDRPWRTNDIAGAYRFLQRLWRCVVDAETGAVTVSDRPLSEDTTRLLHTTIASVREDLGGLRFNTAVAELMKLTSHAVGLAREAGAIPRQLAEPLTLMLAPLAPHLAEELWSKLGYGESLAYQAFPEADESALRATTVEIPVQVNGKVRFVVSVPAQADQAEIERLLRADAQFAAATAGVLVERVIIVPGRIISLVVRA
jgi:leucyl-tRNA synthetase